MNSIFKLPTLGQLLSQNLKNSLPILAPFVRTKKVARAGSALNRRRTTPGKYRRLYVEDGEWVEADHLLVRQLGLQFYPGENVVFCENHSLKARFAGHVLITLEKLTPYPDSPLSKYVEAGNTVERKFVHVITPPRKGVYTLVETI